MRHKKHRRHSRTVSFGCALLIPYGGQPDAVVLLPERGIPPPLVRFKVPKVPKDLKVLKDPKEKD